MDSVIGSIIAGLIVFGILGLLAFSIIWIVRVPSPVQVSNGSAQATSQSEAPVQTSHKRPLTLAIAASCGTAFIFIVVLMLFAPRGHTPVATVPVAHAQSRSASISPTALSDYLANLSPGPNGCGGSVSARK